MMSHRKFVVLCWIARLWIIGSFLAYFCWLACAVCSAAEPASFIVDREVVFEVSNHPYFVSNALPSGVERVNIDLSLDGGSNWQYRIAHGYPAQYGTNVVQLSMRITPAMWTEQACIGVRTLWTSTQNAIVLHEGHAGGLFSIGGIAIQTPAEGQTVYSPSYISVTWMEAGSEAVTIGVSTNGETFTPVAAVPSPARTNTYTLTISGYATGPLWIAVADAELGDCYDVVQVNCQSLFGAANQQPASTTEKESGHD